LLALISISLIHNQDDHDKLTEIYKLYSGTMLYVAKSILHDNHLAEDAVSEAFIRIIDNLDKIEEVNSYQTRSFVVIIVRNISLNILKKQKHIELQDDFTSYSEDEDSFLDTITAMELYDKIVETISKLNKNYSDILYLKMQMKYSYDDIAKILGISKENAKMRLSRARKALKEQLLKEGYYYEQLYQK